MLLMDDNTLETDPALAFKKGPKKSDSRTDNKTNILSEIAEEDDVSQVSESQNIFSGQRISIGKSLKDGKSQSSMNSGKMSIKSAEESPDFKIKTAIKSKDKGPVNH